MLFGIDHYTRPWISNPSDLNPSLSPGMTECENTCLWSRSRQPTHVSRRVASHHITSHHIHITFTSLDWMNRKTQQCDASRWNGTIQLFGGGCFALVPFGPQEFFYCMEPSAGEAIFFPQLLSDEVPNCSPFSFVLCGVHGPLGTEYVCTWFFSSRE